MLHFFRKAIVFLCVLMFCLPFFANVAKADIPSALSSTTMLKDLLVQIAGNTLVVEGLMGPGIDPHLYEASAGDLRKFQSADVVAVHGLHLEGRLGKVMQSLERINKKVIVLENGLDVSKLLSDEENPEVPDPHIWFDVALWKDCAVYVAEQLSGFYPEHASLYQERLTAYLAELDDLDAYIRTELAKIPEESRVLITAHDAFRYFGRAYGIEVKGLQGISTEAEAGTADIVTLADFIVERKIKAVFVESSVSDKSLRALQEATKAQGFELSIGGELYSDSTGDAASGHESYIAMLKHNIDTIVAALQ